MALTFNDQVLNNITSAAIFPVVTVYCLALFFLYYVRSSRPLKGTYDWVNIEINKSRLTRLTTRYPLRKSDIAPLAIITAVFSFLALFLLGDNVAPQSFFQFSSQRDEVIIELETPVEITSLMFYTGLGTGYYRLDFSEDGTNWHEQTKDPPSSGQETSTYAMEQQSSHVFKWRYAAINNDNPPVKHIRLKATELPIELGEIALYGPDGEIVPRARISSLGAPELFDEQNLVPERPTHMNSMYFDEIYHARTAYEYLRNEYPYETTHPPLGKEIIAASISVFGMTPFGWRFIGAALGVVMLIILYIFLKNMFGKTNIATCGTLLLGFDFMRFVQTRIATIDTYGVFFILLAYFFMYRYITTAKTAPFWRGRAPLALSGIFFAFGCAAKWIVIYAGIGLLAIFIIRLVQLSKYYKKKPKLGFGVYLTKTLIYWMLFFVVVPVVIYCLSYIPYGLALNISFNREMLWDAQFYNIIWENQISMLEYHGTLDAVHQYSSRPWIWILNGRPIMYFNNHFGDMRSAFAAFGNPVVWWGGFVAMAMMAVRVVVYRDEKALFILIGYLSQLLPWAAVTRVVFIYHYFPSTVFLVLAIAHIFNTLYERKKGRYRLAVYGYTSATGAVFAMFYPGLTGIYAPQAYFANLLRWIPGAWPY